MAQTTKEAVNLKKKKKLSSLETLALSSKEVQLQFPTDEHATNTHMQTETQQQACSFL